MFKKIALGVLVVVFFLPAVVLAKGGGGGGHGSSGVSGGGGGISGSSSSGVSSSGISRSSRRSSREVEARGRAEGERELRGKEAEGEIGHHDGEIEDGLHHRDGSSGSLRFSHEGNTLFIKQRLSNNSRISDFDKEDLISFLESQHNGPVDFSDPQHGEDVLLLEKVANDSWLVNQNQRKSAIRRHFAGR